MKLVYGVFLAAEACLRSAEQGVCFSVPVGGVGDKACPQLVKGKDVLLLKLLSYVDIQWQVHLCTHTHVQKTYNAITIM